MLAAISFLNDVVGTKLLVTLLAALFLILQALQYMEKCGTSLLCSQQNACMAWDTSWVSQIEISSSSIAMAIYSVH